MRREEDWVWDLKATEGRDLVIRVVPRPAVIGSKLHPTDQGRTDRQPCRFLPMGQVRDTEDIAQ